MALKISKKNWNEYVRKLAAVNQKASDEMQAWVDKNGIDDVGKLITASYQIVQKYGEAAAELTCQMYDAIAVAQKANVLPAEPASPPGYNYVSKVMHGESLMQQNIAPATGRMVKQTSADTMLQNAKRDGAYFAWVPSGDSCAFCMTIASNGWRRASRKTIQGDHAEHIHNNCNCEFVIDFNGDLEIEGYDPDYYLQMYENAEGNTPAEKTNSIRRGLRQHKDGDKVFITDIAIDKVGANVPSSFTAENAEASISCKKELLDFAKNSNDSNEVACLLNLGSNNRTDFVKGTLNGVTLEEGADSFHLLRTAEPRSLEMIHNHPGLSYFSMNDIAKFLEYDTIRTMSVVTNRGKVMSISKLEKFDRKKFIQIFQYYSEKYPDNPDKCIEKTMKKCYDFGMERS